MKTLAQFVRTTILGGVIFLAPIVVLIVILAKAFGYAKTGVHAVVVHIPAVSDLSVGVATTLSILTVALVCLLAGLIAQTVIAQRLVKGADSNFDLVDAVDKPKHGRPAGSAKVTVVGRWPPASGLPGRRDLLRRPDRKKIAKRAGLLSTHETVAKTDSERLPADLKPHLTAVEHQFVFACLSSAPNQ